MDSWRVSGIQDYDSETSHLELYTYTHPCVCKPGEVTSYSCTFSALIVVSSPFTFTRIIVLNSVVQTFTGNKRLESTY